MLRSGRRGAISSGTVALGPPDEAPREELSPEDRCFLLGQLRNGARPLFGCIDEEGLGMIVNSMRKEIVRAGQVVLLQGDRNCEYFYIVGGGEIAIYVKSETDFENSEQLFGGKVQTVSTGGSFGELALLHEHPRAATAICTRRGTLWALSRQAFLRVRAHIEEAKKRRWATLLGEVDFFKNGLDESERSKLSDILTLRRFTRGQTIVEEGDVGLEMFVVETGGCRCFIGNEEVAQYNVGQYFGEMALLLPCQTRQATVVACALGCSLLCISKRDFDRSFTLRRALTKDVRGYRRSTSLPP